MLSVIVNNDRTLTSGKYQPSRNGYYDVAVTAATVTFLYWVLSLWAVPAVDWEHSVKLYFPFNLKSL